MSMFSKGDSLIDEGCIEIRKRRDRHPDYKSLFFSNSKDQQYSPTAVPDSSSLPVTSWNRDFQDKVFPKSGFDLIWQLSAMANKCTPGRNVSLWQCWNSNSREISKRTTNLLLSKRKWHRSFRHGFVIRKCKVDVHALLLLYYRL